MINNVKHSLNTKILNTKYAEAYISTPTKNYRSMSLEYPSFHLLPKT